MGLRGLSRIDTQLGASHEALKPSDWDLHVPAHRLYGLTPAARLGLSIGKRIANIQITQAEHPDSETHQVGSSGSDIDSTINLKDK